MSKALDRVLQPDGSYRWEEVELTRFKKPEPVIKSKPEKKVITEKSNDFESMTKKQLEEFGRTIGIELDRRQNKKVLIKELEQKLNPST